MNKFSLPKHVTVNGVRYSLNTDYRTVLTVFSAFDDPDLSDMAKSIVFRKLLFPEYMEIPAEHWPECERQAMEFLNVGMEDDGKPKPRLVDWDKDFSLIAAAINSKIGRDIRGEEMHWHTFWSLYMEIGESTFANILDIRQKKAKKKKLEKHEKEFYQENKNLIDIKKKESKQEKEIREKIEKFLGS